MAGVMTRQEARKRLDGIYEKLLNQYIPADESQPVSDGPFWEWENLADAFDREMTGGLMEVLAALSKGAQHTHPGSCPFCRSGHVRWLVMEGQRERQSKHGPVVLPRQVARCRSCGRSFSPSGADVGTGSTGASDTAGCGAGMPGGGADAVRSCGPRAQ